MKVSNTAIGAFVLTGLALGVAFVVLLGSGALTRDSFTLAFDFEGDVSGLAVGAPVTIKGFKIGTVRELRLDYDVETREFRTRALAELTPALVPAGSEMSVAEFMSGDGIDAKRERVLRDLVQDGARAQLNLQSFVTGLLKIDIDFPAETAPATLERSDEGYWVVPTQKSNFEVLQRTLVNLPLRHVVDEGIATLRALRELAESPDLARSVAQSDELIDDVRAIVQRLDGSV
ncbi:MAG TPA: MlaD family protein, partial [Planctomycetota bacterium]|nr:MlaD family protein [Planctomycetota bacterium]